MQQALRICGATSMSHLPLAARRRISVPQQAKLQTASLNGKFLSHAFPSANQLWAVVGRSAQGLNTISKGEFVTTGLFSDGTDKTPRYYQD